MFATTSAGAISMNEEAVHVLPLKGWVTFINGLLNFSRTVIAIGILVQNIAYEFKNSTRSSDVKPVLKV